jgi:hypothetical protein
MGLISDDQLDRLTTMFGRGAADRVVIERAWALESQLRKLETLGTDAGWVPPSRLRVVTMDRRAGVLTNRVLGTYVTAALTHRLRESERAARPWDHTLFLCGADKLRGDVLDRLIDACEATGTGLVLMYRSVPPHVKERLGRGHAAVAFMRLGNAEDARTAAQHIGTRHRLTVAELTDSVGDAVGESLGEPYTSTVNSARTRLSAQALDDEWEPGMPDGAALVSGIASSTGWGRTVRPEATDPAAGGDATDATGADGSRRTVREFVVERHQLQQLPPTAMIFTHAMAAGRQILLVDANPAIMTLPTAHSQEYEEFLREQEAGGAIAANPRAANGRHEAVRRSEPRHEDERQERAPRERLPELEERIQPVRVGRHAAPPGTRARSRRATPPLEAAAPPSEPAANEPTLNEPGPDEQPADQRPNLGPPPERLDFRRRKKR